MSSILSCILMLGCQWGSEDFSFWSGQSETKVLFSPGINMFLWWFLSHVSARCSHPSLTCEPDWQLQITMQRLLQDTFQCTVKKTTAWSGTQFTRGGGSPDTAVQTWTKRHVITAAALLVALPHETHTDQTGSKAWQWGNPAHLIFGPKEEVSPPSADEWRAASNCDTHFYDHLSLISALHQTCYTLSSDSWHGFIYFATQNALRSESRCFVQGAEKSTCKEKWRPEFTDVIRIRVLWRFNT